MKELIEVFISTIKNRRHVLTLIEKLNGLKIKLVCEEREDLLIFQHGEVSLLVDHDDAVTYEISGQRDAMYCLLIGKEKLRILIRNGQLKVRAPFRTVLLIESIFYLTKLEEKYLNIS